MSALADIFASVHLNLETGQFEANAATAADKVGASMGQRVSGKLKSALGGAIGALGGFAFASMLSGAQQLDAATQQLSADTGITGQAAKDAGHSIAEMYKGNLQGMDQIGAAMGVVMNGLHLTGAAADAATAKFLDFATATGQDAAPAVTAIKGDLDAWNLSAEAAGPIMDLLVASHQRYGTSISDNEEMLRRLAPQMTALGMSLSDTVGLLNLFQSAGMDSSKAMFALNTAVKNLKPGQTLNDLIKQVSSIQDPTLRAQEAIKLFGARGGVNLANALKPGITSLDQFKTSADQDTDATRKAADAVKSGFGAQATLILHQFQGSLAEIGVNMGDLVISASMLGPGLMRGLSTGLGALAGALMPTIAKQLGLTLPTWIAGGTAQGVAAAGAEVTAEATGVAAGQAVVATEAAVPAAAAGTTLGGVLGGALAVAIPLAIVVGAAAIADAIMPTVQDLALKTHDAFFGKKGPFDDVGKWLDEQPWPIGPKNTPDINLGPLGDHILGGDSIPKKLAQVGDSSGKALDDSLTSSVTAGTPKVQTAAEKMAAQITASVAAAAADAHVEGAKTMEDVAKGILSKRDAVTSALDTLKTMMKNSMSVTSEIARLAGQLTSKELANGMRDKDPAVRDQAAATRDLILTRLQELGPSAKTWGKDGAALLAAGLKSKDPEIRAAAQSLKGIVDAGLSGVPAAGATAGKGAVDQLAAWLQTPAGKAKVLGAAQTVASWVSQGLAAFHTPAPAAPAPTGGSGGARVIPRQAGGPVEAGYPYKVGERGSEWFVPPQSGTILPHGQGLAPSIAVNVYNPKPEPASTSTRRELRKLAVTGQLSPA